MKKILSLLAAFGVMFYLTSCGDDDGGTEKETETIVKSGVITADETWTADNIYELNGKVFVDGATLTIEPGTIVKGRTGEGANASGLYIARGAKIEAVGSPTKPIIFTSVLDNIQPGELMGTSLDIEDTQKWGGLVLLGNAKISVGSGTENTIEGIAGDEPLGKYGGDDDDDDSGTLKYISIRHGGTTIDPAEGKDINGLTLGGVGRETEISYIEVIANYDDGIECFGGSVDISNLLITYQGDDAIDIDQAYSGTISNFMLIQNAGGDEAFEIDGPEGSGDYALGKFTLQNGTVLSTDGNGSAADFKSKAQGSLNNVKFTGYTTATLKFRAGYDDDNACAVKTDAASNVIADDLTFSTVEFNGGVSVYNADDASSCITDADQTAVEGKVSTATATGASDTGAWDNWTISDLLDIL